MATETGENISRIHIIAYEKIPQDKRYGRVSVVPNDPEAYARALYAELHQSDALGASAILIEEPPKSPAWEGVRDRLSRASSDT